MSPYHVALAVSLASTLTACDPLDILSGKSSFKAEQERRAALSMPVIPASVTPVIEAVADVPVVQVQTCTETFRINHCDGNTIIPWEY